MQLLDGNDPRLKHAGSTWACMGLATIALVMAAWAVRALADDELSVRAAGAGGLLLAGLLVHGMASLARRIATAVCTHETGHTPSRREAWQWLAQRAARRPTRSSRITALNYSFDTMLVLLALWLADSGSTLIDLLGYGMASAMRIELLQINLFPLLGILILMRRKGDDRERRVAGVLLPVLALGTPLIAADMAGIAGIVLLAWLLIPNLWALHVHSGDNNILLPLGNRWILQFLSIMLCMAIVAGDINQHDTALVVASIYFPMQALFEYFRVSDVPTDTATALLAAGADTDLPP